MKKLLLGTAMVSFAALANGQTLTATDTTSKPVDASASTETININAADAVVADTKRNCVTGQTGTHIKQKDEKACNGLPGNSYSRDDLEDTGAMNTAEALQLLDPAITIGH